MAELAGHAVRVETFLTFSTSALVTVLAGEAPRIAYEDGFADGEIVGFSSPHEHVMPPILLGETDADNRTVAFHIYTKTGLPASGIAGQGGVCTPVGAQLQVNRDLAGYVNGAGACTHVGDGEYRYTFTLAEVSGSEGNIWLRVKVDAFRTVVLRVPLRVRPPDATTIRDAILAAGRTGFVGVGTVGEGVAIATSLLQGNFFMDQVLNGPNGQTSARVRCFHTGAAAQAATRGGAGEGEFATFIVTTLYAGPGKVLEHRVVQA